MMRLLRLGLALWLLALAPAQAGDGRYENLLSQLAGAPDQAEAERLAGEIWQIWLTAPDPAAQEVLDAAMTRRQAYDFLGALDHLDRLVTGWPDYAEGWNQRATMHFLRGDFEASLADMAQVLTREPRHFGALSGKAVILFEQGRLSLARIAIAEALKHHPFLNERFLLQIPAGEEL